MNIYDVDAYKKQVWSSLYVEATLKSNNSCIVANSFFCDRCGPCSGCSVLLAQHLLHYNHCLGHLLPVQLLHHCKYYTVCFI